MTDPHTDPQAFAARFDKNGLKSRRAALIGFIVVALLVLGSSAFAVHAVSSGVFFEEARATGRTSRTHIIRTHGWGGYYVGPRAGRSHFGGGGRIH